MDERRRAVAAKSCATSWQANRAIRTSSPARLAGRARRWRSCATALARNPAGYRIDPRLTEVGFGEWEGSTLEELSHRSPEAVAARDRDKWGFTPPGAESYAMMSVRMRDWYDSLMRDTVAVAHGGTLRGLIVQIGISSAEDAPFLDIGQGVVYVIRDGKLTRHG